MTPREQQVINQAKAAARAVRRWLRSPTTENQARIHKMEARLERIVASLEREERGLKDSALYHQAAIKADARRRTRKPRP